MKPAAGVDRDAVGQTSAVYGNYTVVDCSAVRSTTAEDVEFTPIDGCAIRGTATTDLKPTVAINYCPDCYAAT